MGIFESFIGLACIIVIFIMGFAAGVECQKSKCYDETTKLIKKINEAMDPMLEMYQKILKDYEKLM